VIITPARHDHRVNKLIRMLGLRLPSSSPRSAASRRRKARGVRHPHEPPLQPDHWIETIADVEVIAPDARGLVTATASLPFWKRYRDRPLKIARSRVLERDGHRDAVHQLARIMHEHDGYCFVDFAASAPYVTIDMHPPTTPPQARRRFLLPAQVPWRTGTPGVLVFDSSLYHNRVPTSPEAARSTGPTPGRNTASR